MTARGAWAAAERDQMYDSEPYPTPLYDGKGGVGGGGAGSVPVSQGSYEVVVQVTLVYEVK